MRPMTASHQRNNTQTQLMAGSNTFASPGPTIFERPQPSRPVSVSGRPGFKGKKIRTHQRLKSAAPGGRAPQDANSVADFVKASADPRGGIWAQKAYKTPHVFVEKFYHP